MKRRKFITTSIKGGLALSIASQYSFISLQEKYSKNQLIGKDESNIVGNSYTTKMHKETSEAFKRMFEEYVIRTELGKPTPRKKRYRAKPTTKK